MAAVAAHDWLRDGAKQRHRGQPVHEPAGQQHHQQQQLEQPGQQHHQHLQRQRARLAYAASQRDCPGVYGRWYGQLLDWRVRLRVLQCDWLWWRNLPTRRAVRAAQARQNHERVWAQGGSGCDLVPRRASVSRHGYGGYAVSIPRGNWQTGHVVVATKPRHEA